MKKTYFYANYQLDEFHEVYASVIEANSKQQIKRVQMHLFEHYSRYDSYKEAMSFIMLNVNSLGANINFRDIKRIDVTNF